MNRFFRSLAAAALLLASPAGLSAASRDIEFNDAAGKAWPTVNHAQASAAGARPADQRLRPALDFDSLIRNPATGWMLYDDALGDVAKADEYWQAMDEAARKHASIFYLPLRWAEAEPEEGRYAWLYDPNFKALIEGARQRNLRLAFRFYVNSQSNLRQATPDYVRRAGAEGLMETGQRGPLWTPYADDPVFQKKLSAFVAAFAKEFDDPARVDFVDALGLGWWGEGHHIPFKNATNSDQTLRWILDTYAKPFQRVLLGWQFHTTFGMNKDEEVAIKGEDYVYRRDGLGSHWFSELQAQVDRDNKRGNRHGIPAVAGTGPQGRRHLRAATPSPVGAHAPGRICRHRAQRRLLPGPHLERRHPSGSFSAPGASTIHPARRTQGDCRTGADSLVNGEVDLSGLSVDCPVDPAVARCRRRVVTSLGNDRKNAFSPTGLRLNAETLVRSKGRVEKVSGWKRYQEPFLGSRSGNTR